MLLIPFLLFKKYIEFYTQQNRHLLSYLCTQYVQIFRKEFSDLFEGFFSLNFCLYLLNMDLSEKNDVIWLHFAVNQIFCRRLFFSSFFKRYYLPSFQLSWVFLSQFFSSPQHILNMQYKSFKHNLVIFALKYSNIVKFCY